jgi:hypothetical protein
MGRCVVVVAVDGNVMAEGKLTGFQGNAPDSMDTMAVIESQDGRTLLVPVANVQHDYGLRNPPTTDT